MKPKKETFKNRYDENKTLIKNYTDFLFSECHENDRLRLIGEIAKLDWQCEIIENMEEKEMYNVLTSKRKKYGTR